MDGAGFSARSQRNLRGTVYSLRMPLNACFLQSDILVHFVALLLRMFLRVAQTIATRRAVAIVCSVTLSVARRSSVSNRHKRCTIILLLVEWQKEKTNVWVVVVAIVSMSNSRWALTARRKSAFPPPHSLQRFVTRLPA